MSVDSNQIIIDRLDTLSNQVEEAFDCDVVALCSPIMYGVEDLFRDAIEAIENKKPRLGVVLETVGGYIEVAERLVNITRHHYQEVEFIIPSHALSAGTVIAMSGDAIWMDYYSILGPIDPQIQGSEGRLVPATGYLDRYKQLIKRAESGKLTSAEGMYLIERFDPAELFKFEQETELSETLLVEWLVKFKFKDWNKTQTKGEEVTEERKKDTAKRIARDLGDASIWHSHGRGITMEMARSMLKLMIDDFGQDEARAVAIKNYHRLLTDFQQRLSYAGCVHANGTFMPTGIMR